MVVRSWPCTVYTSAEQKRTIATKWHRHGGNDDNWRSPPPPPPPLFHFVVGEKKYSAELYTSDERAYASKEHTMTNERSKKKTLLLYTQHAWHQEEKNKCITDGKVIITLKYHFLSSSLYNFILARTFYVWLGEREVARPACTHLRCTMDAVRIRVRLHSTIMLTVGTIYAANSCRVTQTKTTRKKLISRVHIWKMFLDGRMAIDAHMDANACTHTSVHVAYNMHVSHEYAHDRYDYGIDVRVRFDKCNNRDKK